MKTEQEAFRSRSVSKPYRLLRHLATRTTDLGARKLGLYPFEATVGILGIEGAYPRAQIRNHLDILRMLFLVDERPYARRMVRTLGRQREGSCFLDVGAAAGAYSLLAGYILKRGTVVAVEPDPSSFEQLVKNIQLNRFSSCVIAMQTALGSEYGTATLYTDGAEGVAPRLRPAKGLDNAVETRVETVDELIEEEVMPSPTVVKIDVEGAEADVLLGMSETLGARKSAVSDIFLELHREAELIQFGTKRAEVLEIVDSFGFKPAFRQVRAGIDLIHFKR